MSKVIQNIGDEASRAAVLSAIMGCTRQVPFLGYTINNLKLEFDTRVPAAATNGRVLKVNPDVFASFEPGERIGIIAHEAMHVLFQHSKRFWGYDKDRANDAADYAINGWLLGKGFDLPADTLYDAEFDGLGAMEIYHRLPERRQQQGPKWGSFELGDDPNPDPDEIPAEAAGAGLEELYASEFGLEPRAHRFSLEHVLTRLLIQEPVWERDYRRPSRISDDFPAWIDIDQRPKVVVGLDISGSIRQEIRETFLGVLSRVVTPVTVVACDTAIRERIWREVCATNVAACCAEMPKTGGGTLFQPVIDFAARARANLVYLTDGETPEPRLVSKGVPITWLIWGPSPNTAAMAPVGRIIHVET